MKAQLPKWRVRSGYDVIAGRFFAEVICDGSLVATYFHDDPATAESRARARIAQETR